MTKQEAMGHYDDFLEDIRETASDEVRETYQEIHDGFEAYLDAFVIYFCLSKIIGIGQKALEKHFGRQGAVK